jgi:DNA-binding response OmpR family regulator
MISLCLIEDNQKLWSMLQESLLEEWYSCDRYTSIESFPNEHIARYHIFLLDINLPWMDGVTFAESLREKWTVGIIFLTANGTLDDKMKWFDAGADDYIVKPFATAELVVRIDSLSTRLSDKHYFIYKDIYIDWKHREAKKWETHVHLTPIEREVLWCLLRDAWYQCNRSDIIDHVWWHDALFSMSRSLDVAIAHLRKKLDKEMIETISGVWYKLNKTS